MQRHNLWRHSLVSDWVEILCEYNLNIQNVKYLNLNNYFCLVRKPSEQEHRSSLIR